MAIEVPREAENDVMKLQQLQQQMQFLTMQKQSLQNQSLELEHSTEELKKVVSEDVFEIVGAIMIKRDKDLLLNDLVERKHTIDLRQSAVEKQVDKVAAKTQELQEKVMKMVKGGK